jgi:diguanylate cyclase (GGDEF)-like protein
MVDVLTDERKRFVRTGRAFCVATLDLDHFKRVNDSWGHQAGDAVLAGFAAVSLDVLRKCDVLARWGGEEFLLLMPETTRNEALVALERIRHGLDAYDWGSALPAGQRVTFSAGVTQYGLGEPLEAALERSDRALYAAKNAGRNRTVPA